MTRYTGIVKIAEGTRLVTKGKTITRLIFASNTFSVTFLNKKGY